VALSDFRMQHAVPILERLHAWLGVAEAKVLPKSALGEATRYALNPWAALNVYVTDGRLEIDNNAAERALRPIAVARKNWLFFQSQGGGRTAAILMSLIQTARAAGVNAKLYLRDVLQRIAVESDVKRLLPHGWKQHYEAEVVGRRHELLGIAGEQPRLSRGTRVKDPLGQAAVGVKRRLPLVRDDQMDAP